MRALRTKAQMFRLFRRSLLWLLPVVVIPLITLLVLQYRFLRSLERTQVSANRDWLRGAVEEVAHEIEKTYRAAANQALSVPAGASNEELAAHFSAHRLPGAKSFFVVRFKENGAHYDGFDPRGGKRTVDAQEMQAIKLSTVSWHVVHKYRTIVHSPPLQVDERDPQNRIILRPVTDEATRVVAVAGAVLDERVARAAMTAMGSDALRKYGGMVTLRIGDAFPVQQQEHSFITHPLGFLFTDWRAGVKDLCGSPEEMAAYQFKMNSLWTGGAAVVLIGALFLAFQATSRQMRLSQMKSDFVSNVSHELRTPLASIRVFGEYMRLGRVTREEKIREYGEYIEAESRRLTQLINNILDFSKIESAEKKYKFVDTDVQALVSETVAAFAMPLREHGLSIRFQPSPLPLMLQIDQNAIAQALVNLLDNAVKYSGERKEIEVAVTASPRDVRIAVRDYGIGIAACEQKKIFEKFYRVSSGLVHDVKGSGLGLAIVNHVVRAHGGRVEVASQPGQGSTFTIVLPVGAPPAPAPAAADSSPTTKSTEFA